MARYPIDDDDEEEKEQGAICKRRRRLLIPADDDENEEEVVEQSQVRPPVHVVLNDLEVFDCPICLHKFLTNVFQCVNGRIACFSCCSKVKSKCPFCCMPIGMSSDSRCRGLEKLIGSIFISCKCAINGCELRTPYSNKNEHEQLCPYVTCFCPQPSCSFTV